MRELSLRVVMAASFAVLAGCSGVAPGTQVTTRPAQQAADQLAGTSASQATEEHSPCDKQSLADVDGDGRADTVVGMPSYTAERPGPTGAVDVHGTTSGARLLTPADLGPVALGAGGFGSAIAVTDLDNDGCIDAVIGAPGEVSGGAAGPGQAYIVFGSPRGLDPGTAVRLPRPATATEADGFGSALALRDRRADPGEVRDYDLYVGAPGTTVDSKDDAGQVWRYRITVGGLRRVTVTVLGAHHPGADGVPGAPTAGERFGEVLAAGGHAVGELLVGVPAADVAGVRDAGAVWSLPFGESGRLLRPERWVQGSAGVPDRAEAGDRFGAALAGAGKSVVVGAPGEDAGPVRDAGLAQVFVLNEETGSLEPRRAITQGSRGIPGAARAGDRFGAAVAVGGSLDGPGSGTVDAAIGAPGDDLGSVKDVGSILLVPVSDGSDPVDPRLLRQGRGLQGRPEAGDAVGSVLASAGGLLGFDEDYTDLLTIGVPGEDVGNRRNAGMVQWSPLGLRPPRALVRFSGGPHAGGRYGTVLPSFAE